MNGWLFSGLGWDGSKVLVATLCFAEEHIVQMSNVKIKDAETYYLGVEKQNKNQPDSYFKCNFYFTRRVFKLLAWL